MNYYRITSWSCCIFKKGKIEELKLLTNQICTESLGNCEQELKKYVTVTSSNLLSLQHLNN